MFPSMKSLPDFKRGDTFQLGCLAKDAEVVPEDLSGVALRAQVRAGSTGQLVAELVVSKADQAAFPGQFSVSALTTDNWPVAMLLIDIEKRVGQAVSSTETIKLNVIADITHD